MKTLRVHWTARSVDEFLARHGEVISADRVFLATSRPLEAGARVRFDLRLGDQSTFLSGTARVAATADPATGRSGMLLRFEEIDPEHADLVSRLRDEVTGGAVDLSERDDGPFADDEDTRPDAHPAGLKVR
jgi:hypothetical protein